MSNLPSHLGRGNPADQNFVAGGLKIAHDRIDALERELATLQLKTMKDQRERLVAIEKRLAAMEDEG